MNNLNQLGTGIESYMGDYGGYYPVKPAYGVSSTYAYIGSGSSGDDVDGDVHDRGVIIDSRTGDTVETNANSLINNSGNAVYSSATVDMTIAYGTNTNAAYQSGNGYTGTDHLQAGPVGLGYLAWSGYVNDLKTFYCPSYDLDTRSTMITGSFGTRSRLYWQDGYYNAGTNTGVVDILPAIRALGGSDGRLLTEGNYRAAGNFRGTANANYFGTGSSVASTPKAVGAHSSYSYRNVAVLDTSNRVDPTAVYAVHWTNPFITMKQGCPPFKTAKFLGGRSLAADTFFRSYVDGTSANVPNLPGYGWQHHKEGYNVLYGDHHVAWFGDAEQRVMWAGPAPNTKGETMSIIKTGYEPYANNQSASIGSPCAVRQVPGDTARSSAVSVNGRQNIFHQFDVAAGVDAGTLPVPF